MKTAIYCLAYYFIPVFYKACVD